MSHSIHHTRLGPDWRRLSLSALRSWTRPHPPQRTEHSRALSILWNDAEVMALTDDEFAQLGRTLGVA